MVTTIHQAKMSLRCRGAPSGFPAHSVGRSRQLVPRAASVLAMPTKEVGLPQRSTTIPGSRTLVDVGEPGAPPSSGLDFIDLVGLDDSTVWNRLQDAMTYRVLVGCSPISPQPSRPSHVETFNVKQLKLYRDNVTRNLAPTVARGFANAARAANYALANVHVHAQPAQAARQSQSLSPPPQRQQQGVASPAAPPAGSASTTIAVATGAAAEVVRTESPQRRQQQHPHTLSVAAATAAAAGGATSHSTGGGGGGGGGNAHQTRRVSLAAAAARPAEQHRIAVKCQAQATAQEGCAATSDRADCAAGTSAATASTPHASGRFGLAEQSAPSSPSVAPSTAAVSGSSLFFEGVGSASASALVSGRRRGNRGAGRGPLLAAAGRQAGVATGAGAAWT